MKAIPYDKKLHILAGIIGVTWAFIVLYFIFYHLALSLIAAATITDIIAWIKEDVHDGYFGLGTEDAHDYRYTRNTAWLTAIAIYLLTTLIGALL